MHYLLLALIPANSTDIYGEVARLMARYDCEIEVDQYRTECYCIEFGIQARAEEDALRQGFSPDPDLHYNEDSPEKANRLTELNNCILELTDDEARELELLQQEFSAAQALAREPFAHAVWDFKQHLLLDSSTNMAGPTCPSCRGSGEMWSTSNPDGQYDYWLIGGRFSGHFSEVSCWSTGTPPPYSDKFAGDIIPVKWLFKSIHFPYALVTPDGEWHEFKNEPWNPLFVQNANERTWEELCQRIYTQYPDYLAVVCDYHS